MDAEHKVISALIREGSTRALTDAHITPDYFASPVHRRVLTAILNHQARYGSVPTAPTLLDKHPGYALDETPEPIAVYLDALTELYRGRLLQEGLDRAVDALDRGHLDASQQALAATLSAVTATAPRSGHLDLRASGGDRMERYRAFREHTGLRGIPTGFPTIDRATLGLQAGQLIAIGGLAKGGKSAALGAIGRNAHRDAYGNGVELVPLLYTIEMTGHEMGERLDSLYAGLDSSKLRAGELNQAEWLRLERAVAQLEKMPSFHIEKGIAHLTTLSEIAAKLERHKPDLLLVDGIYLMRDERTGEVGTPQAITSLTQGFKSLADRWEIPTVITSQFLPTKVDRKRGGDAFSFGYANSFAMDADVIIALDPTDADDVKHMKIVAARNCPNVSAYVRWDWKSATFEELAENPYQSTAAGAKESPW